MRMRRLGEPFSVVPRKNWGEAGIPGGSGRRLFGHNARAAGEASRKIYKRNRRAARREAQVGTLGQAFAQ